MDLQDADYQRLLTLRDSLRRFLHWSEEQARAVGLTPAQHQLLLAVRGDLDPHGPTIGAIAEHLMVKHHSAVELVNRAQAAGLVRREADGDDSRVVRVRLTERAQRDLEALAGLHLEELERLRTRMAPLWAGLG